ncbi:class I SAM-dependent methyltransferase [Streptosporangium lutulentum]
MRWNARAYDSSFGYVSAHGAPLVELLDPQPGERIVDLGCGTGVLTAEITSRGARVLGIDGSQAMIEKPCRSIRAWTSSSATAATSRSPSRTTRSSPTRPCTGWAGSRTR